MTDAPGSTNGGAGRGPTQRVVVTGGAGFIGSHIVDICAAEGWPTLVVDDLSTGKTENVVADYGVEFEKADMTDLNTSFEIVRFQPDIIFHLAAQTDVATSVRFPTDDAETNVLGTLTAIQAAKDSAAKLVFASTGGAIYGECYSRASEQDAPDPRSPYAVSKLSAEWYIRVLHTDHLILRYANVYGPRQSSAAEGGVVARFLDWMARDEPLSVYGTGEQERDFVYVADVAQATVQAALERSGIFNVGTGYGTSILDLAAMLGQAHNIAFEPARPGDIQRSVLDCDRLRYWLGWQPRSLKDGLAAMLLGQRREA